MALRILIYIIVYTSSAFPVFFKTYSHAIYSSIFCKRSITVIWSSQANICLLTYISIMLVYTSVAREPKLPPYREGCTHSPVTLVFAVPKWINWIRQLCFLNYLETKSHMECINNSSALSYFLSSLHYYTSGVFIVSLKLMKSYRHRTGGWSNREH